MKNWNQREGTDEDDDRVTNIGKARLRKLLRELAKDMLWDALIKAAIAVGVFSVGYNLALWLHQ